MAVPYTVTLPGGGSITVNANSEAAARENAQQQTSNLNWGGGGGGQVFNGGHQTIQNSAGQTVYNSGASQSGTGGGGGGGNGDLASGYEALSGYEYDALAQNQKQFEANLAFQKDQLERLGIPQFQLQKWVAEQEDKHFQDQLALAKQAQEFSQGIQAGELSGMYNGAPTEAARQFNANQAEAARQFNSNQGLNYLSQAAGFAASDPFALSDFMRGAQANPDVPTFIKGLQQNVGPQAQVGPPAQANAPTAITYGTLSNALGAGGQPSTTPGRADRTLGAIRDIYTRGPDTLAAGSLEGLDQNEMNTLNAGLSHVGGSAAAPAFLEKYRRNAVRSQASGTPAYSAY